MTAVTVALVDAPGTGRWRLIRGAVLALVCCGLPLYGYSPDRVADRGPVIAVMALLACVLGVRVAASQVSFSGLTGAIVTGQLAMHGLLALTIDRPDPAEVWTYHPDLPRLEWLSGAHGTARMLASELLLDLVVAAVLYGCECSVWTWFRLAALRLLSPVPSLAPPLAPETPTVHPVCDTPAYRPLLLVSACGRRGPPVRPAA